MAQKIELNISESTLEQLRCTICRGYLSCPPIRILPDGGSICGRCSPAYENVPTYVEFCLEAILRNATFPCKFNQNGCKIRLGFAFTSRNNHEAECAYRFKPSLDLPTPSCSSQATSVQVIKEPIVLRNSELTVKLDEGEKEISNESTVINPFNARRRSSNPSIIASTRNWNGYINRPHSSRANNFNGNVNNSFDRNGNNYNHRNWYSHNNNYRRPYHNKRKKDVVVIKGRTIYVTL